MRTVEFKRTKTTVSSHDDMNELSTLFSGVGTLRCQFDYHYSLNASTFDERIYDFYSGRDTSRYPDIKHLHLRIGGKWIRVINFDFSEFCTNP